ncbi:aminotransferase class I/II-fold pyridoxal phosphate-dependent enzyme [Novosphingobium piscinae]|uniref:8-amino-7-oxononanoate synthase n=1 Tax=Novosphingobium piscinae TaxID=1507448 RepID=A0A7X1KR33_9SPHN|nr:8-amino-7-oxononanoate synthase [Novosphingobium piscinae]MBC2670376.1 8-amino-7-oxononanoate synthase [Novosphingobium piscinae]
MGSFDERLADALAAIRQRGRWRTLRAAQLAPGGRIGQDGRGLIDLSSNDYLGLACHPLLAERAADWGHAYGTGAGASRLVTGTNAAHLAIEARIAAFKGTPAALLFASGWQANAAVLPALLAAAPGAAVFTDRLVHASMHAGLAGVRQHRFRHNDLAHLADLLARHGRAAPARFIFAESVYSMDGDRADVPALAELARAHDAVLMIDEAHATGVLGPGGAGLCHGVAGVDLVMGTFSKAFGSFGAYVACSELLRDYLVNACSGFIFSTAPPPPVLGAIDAALDLVPAMTAERAHLAALADRLRTGLAARGYDTAGSSTQIVPAIVGAEAATLALSARLAEAGLLAAAIRPPTVPAGTSRLRLALRATHSADDVDALLEALA